MESNRERPTSRRLQRSAVIPDCCIAGILACERDGSVLVNNVRRQECRRYSRQECLRYGFCPCANSTLNSVKLAHVAHLIEAAKGRHYLVNKLVYSHLQLYSALWHPHCLESTGFVYLSRSYLYGKSNWN